jgi:vomeronasal1 receptor
LSTWVASSFLFFWITNLLIYIQNILVRKVNSNSTVLVSGNSQASCQIQQLEHNYSTALTSVMVIRDVLFVVLMLWTSLYMVCLLYTHHRRAQHVHSPSLSSQPSPESKAIYSIILLVSSFVLFYFLYNFSFYYWFYRSQKNTIWEKITGIISSCYQTICPFVLMKNNKILSTFSSSLSKVRVPISQ